MPLHIMQQFNIKQVEYCFTSVSHGLINQSFVIKRISDNKPLYFLQKINHHIFKDVDALMYNISSVNQYFKELPTPPAHLELILTKKKHPFYKTHNGTYWRMYKYIPGTTYFKAESLELASEAGNAYGTFLSLLSGLNPTELTVTLPDFHDINLRLKQLEESLFTATEKRLKKATPWIKLINDNKKEQSSIFNNIIKTCPLRITHNDTKLSNLLFDANHKAKCVIDYDTIMPGYLPLDFGDAVRTICSTTMEDDKHIEQTYYHPALVKAFTDSFITSLQGVLTQAELMVLPKAAIYMPFLMGVRMLTDYLENDIYYNTHYADHNLDRAANQLTLFKKAIENEVHW